MRKGRIIIICGLPGSGKSTMAKKLKKQLNAVSLITDKWMIKLFGSSNRPEDRANVEDIQFELAVELSKRGEVVILEYGFWSSSERLSFIDKANSAGVNIEAVFMIASSDLLNERISKRNLNLGESEYYLEETLIEDFLGRFQEPDEAELKQYSQYEIIRQK